MGLTVQQKIVMGLLDAGNLLVMHMCVRFDNWFNSVELLLVIDTYGAGTVRINLPKVVVGKTVKLKGFETLLSK